MTRVLRRDQLRAVQGQIHDLILQHQHLMIVLPMGGGKSAATLTAALDLLDRFVVRRVLVVAPLRVARDVWPAEVRVWEHTRNISVALAVGNAKIREAAVAAEAEITVTNFENLVWLYKHHGGPAGWPYDMLIVDESSAFKAGKQRTTTTKRKNAQGRTVVTKGGNMTRFGALAKVRRKFKRVVLLTGTPGSDLESLWGQMFIVDMGERLGRTKSAFEQRWFHKNAYSYEMKPLPHAHDEIMARIKDVMFSFPPPDDLPEPVFVPVHVDLPASALAEYRVFKRKLVTEVYDVEALSQGVLTNKLLQFANGSMYREDRSVVHIHDAKLDALDDLIQQAAGDPLLVFYSFKFDLDRILERHPKAVVLNRSPTAVEDWNAGKIPLLLAHPKSCAHGLNLQFGGHLAVWYGFTWSPELYLQANARLARPGQKWPVAIYQIIANGTDDARLLSVIADGEATQDSIIAAVRHIILDA